MINMVFQRLREDNPSSRHIASATICILLCQNIVGFAVARECVCAYGCVPACVTGVCHYSAHVSYLSSKVIYPRKQTNLT